MSKLKFKVGDKVRTPDGEGIIIGIAKTGQKKYLVEIEGFLGHSGDALELLEGKRGKKNNCWWFEENMLKLKQFTKADLKDDDKITLVNGNSFYYKNGDFTIYYKNGDFTNYFYSSYDDELKRIDNLSEREIARIERPNYETVYERVEEPIKKMTVADIQKELGYKVEIVE